MKILGKLLCWLGIHTIDEKRWSEKEIWGEDVFETNLCLRCNQLTIRHNGKRKSFRRLLNKLK